MSKTIEELRLKKDVLQAKSTLYRLKVHRDIQNIEGKLHWVGVGAQIVKSIPFRSTLLSYFLKSGRHVGVSKALGFSAKIILFAKIAKTVLSFLKRSKSAQSETS